MRAIQVGNCFKTLLLGYRLPSLITGMRSQPFSKFHLFSYVDKDLKANTDKNTQTRDKHLLRSTSETNEAKHSQQKKIKEQVGIACVSNSRF